MDLRDSIPLCRCKNFIAVCVKLFEIFPERFVRDDIFDQWDDAIIIRQLLLRKGAEGQKGEYHCQRQKGTDKARSF